MFNFSKEEISNHQVEKKVEKMFSKMLSQAILNSNTASESMKLTVRVVDKAGDIVDTLRDKITEKYCDPKNRANVETLEKVLEYLEMVRLGIVQFSETTPFVAETEEDKR